MAKKNKKENVKPSRNFSLLKAIRGKKQGDIVGESILYKMDTIKRDERVRRWVKNNIESTAPGNILPGSMIMFNYFQPMTKDDLEYYDAMPCTIFFGTFETSKGKRVVGWNLHYYPPKLRFLLMDKIFTIFKDYYTMHWNDERLRIAAQDFDYKTLMAIMKSKYLDFGVREYAPNLMSNVKRISPKDFQKAVFTEGHFRKETRQKILQYWKNPARFIWTLGRIQSAHA